MPFWLFLIVALYLYFVPITGAGKVSAPFFVLLLLSIFQNQSVVAAVIFGVIFYFIILIKDLLIIDRRSAYEILMLVLAYLLMRSFFIKTGGALDGWTIIYGLVAAWAISAMTMSFIKNFSVPQEAVNLREAKSFHRMLGWMTFLLTWQLLVIGIFLPLNFLYQSAIVFLVLMVILDLVPQYVFGELSRTRVLATAMVLFSLLVIITASARWTL